MTCRPNYLITTPKIKARYEHHLRLAAAQRNDLAAAVGILHDTRSLRRRWTHRHRRRWAKATLRKGIRGGMSAWYERDPFVWDPPKPVETRDLPNLVGPPPKDSAFWKSFREQSEGTE